MLKDIIDWFKKLFGIAVKKTEGEQAEALSSEEKYKSTDKLNLVSIVSNRLANITCADSTIEVVGIKNEKSEVIKNPRADFLNECLQSLVSKLKLVTVRAFGIGGVVLKPYIYNGRIYADILPQSDFFVIEQTGEVITKAGFIADTILIDSVKYVRIEYHTLDPTGTYTIENKALKDGKEVPLDSVPAWANIQPMLTIAGVNQMLFSVLKCPVDSKSDTKSAYGVSVMFGQDKLVKTILDLLDEIPDEYKNKKAFIGAEDLLFDSTNKLPESGLYKLLRTGGGQNRQSFWEVFSPEIRHTSYFAGLDYLFGLLEKAIGVNKGVLTDLDTADATATAMSCRKH